jgi:hypothetical protein
MDYETAMQNGLLGWWWASVAADTGTAAAAAYPLGERDEDTAQQFAGVFTDLPPNAIAFLREQADAYASQAVIFYRASQTLLREARAVSSAPETLLRDLREAVRVTHFLGHMAAKAQRSLILIGEPEGGE